MLLFVFAGADFGSSNILQGISIPIALEKVSIIQFYYLEAQSRRMARLYCSRFDRYRSNCYYLLLFGMGIGSAFLLMIFTWAVGLKKGENCILAHAITMLSPKR